MRILTALALAVPAILIAFANPAIAKTIPHASYLDYLPLAHPRLVMQTGANAEFSLFGQADDTDANSNGIGDAAEAVLHRLAMRFSPILVQNTTNIPMDFSRFKDVGPGLLLHVDTWDITSGTQHIADSEIIDFGLIGECDCAHTAGLCDDCRLIALLKEPRPRIDTGTILPHVSPRRERFKVMYIDFPGHDEKTWKSEYEGSITGQLTPRYRDFLKTYAHPFICAVDQTSGADPGYEFVIQYWLFYPTNDGGNNHEGDWEHINVVIGPQDRIAEPLSASDIRRILQGDWLPPGGEFTVYPQDTHLVIKRVEYYFHHNVMVLDYTRPNVYLPYDEWKVQREACFGEQAGIGWQNNRIRYYAYQDDSGITINTHPIGFIGADSKGTDQLLAMPGMRNRDSHGTYPFSGHYKDVGPLNAIEKIPKHFSAREYFHDRRVGNEQKHCTFKRGGVVCFDSAQIELLPDWEQVAGRVEMDADLRRNMAWMLLPIRWGYPATVSPLAGTVAHADMGNVSPIGPARNTAWNRVGPAFGYELYTPHYIINLYPLAWQDRFQNRLGFLNLVFPTMAIVPPFDAGYNFVRTSVIKLGFKAVDPVMTSQEDIPYRSFGSAGVFSLHLLSTRYAGLLRNAAQQSSMRDQLGVDDDVVFDSMVSEMSVFVTEDWGYGAGVVYFVGNRLASESGFHHSTNRMGFTATQRGQSAGVPVRADLNFWEFWGSWKYYVMPGTVQPFLRIGYGLSWYRLENTTVDGERLSVPNSPWVRRPSFKAFHNLLPNSWHFGAGLEWIPLKRLGRGEGLRHRGADISLNLDYRMLLNRRGLHEGDNPVLEAFHGERRRTLVRHVLTANLTLGL